MDQKEKHVCDSVRSFSSSYTLHWETAKEKVLTEENIPIMKSQNTLLDKLLFSFNFQMNVAVVVTSYAIA